MTWDIIEIAARIAALIAYIWACVVILKLGCRWLMYE